MLQVVDCHQHLWDVDNHYYPWLAEPMDLWIGDYSSIRRNYLAEDYVQETSPEVVASVDLHAMWDPAAPVGESRWLTECAARVGRPNACIGFVDLAHPQARTVLEGHLEYPLVRGIRQDLNWHADPRFCFAPRPDLMTDAQWLRNFSYLADHDLSFELQIYASEQGQQAVDLVDRFSTVQFVLTHIGLPYDRSAAGLQTWRDNVSRLAERPNVACKVSGLCMFDQQWTPDSLAPFIHFALSTFGEDRCVFGSNFPVERLYGSFSTLLTAYRQILSVYPERVRRKFFSENAQRIYRLETV